MGGLCAALSELHAHGIVHRDLSPTNVIVADDGLHLIDFGNACLVGAPDSAGEAPQGTWGSAAPEQHGFAAPDIRSDIFALGRLAAYLLTGSLPEGVSYQELRAHIVGLAPAVQDVILCACAFEPSARFQTVDALARAFDAAISGGKDSAPSASFTTGTSTSSEMEHVGRHVVRKRLPHMAIVVAVAACVAVAALGLLVVGTGILRLFGDGETGEDAGDAPAAHAEQTGDAPSASNTDNASSTDLLAPSVDEAYAALELVETG